MQLVQKKLPLSYHELDLDIVFNELQPLLFISLKLWLLSTPKTESTQTINTLADFYLHDSNQTLLLNSKLLSKPWLTIEQHLRHVLPILEMITRLFTLNSRKHRSESTYWLKYAFKVAGTLRERRVPRTREILDEDEEIDEEEEMDGRGELENLSRIKK